MPVPAIGSQRVNRQKRRPYWELLKSVLMTEVTHMGEMIKVAKTNDLGPGEAMCVEVAGQRVALFNTGGSYYAIADSCTHVGGPL